MNGIGLSASSVVGVARVEESVSGAVERAMELADWASRVPVGSRVAVKPNLCWDLPLPGAQTSPWVLDAVLGMLERRAGEIVVVEAGQVTVDVDVALERCGLGRIVRKHGIEFVNMSRGRFLSVHLDGALVLSDVLVPEVLSDRVLVSVPVLKTHGTTLLSAALKNQWGCLPETRHRYHPVVHEAIADLNDVLRPAFAVLDATVALEGRGPKTGAPRIVDLVAASADLVALDAMAARIVGLDPIEVAHIRFAEQRGLGSAAGAVLRGDEPRPVPGFRAPAPNLVGRAEAVARRSPATAWAFDSPTLRVLTGAARLWNRGWWWLVGSRLRARVLAHSRYGAQWWGVDEADVLRSGRPSR